jgi:hypothetical protein
MSTGFHTLKKGKHQWLEICNLPVATADGNLHLLLLTKRSSRNEDIRRRSAASPADRPRRPTKPEAAAVDSVGAVAATAAAGAVVIARVPPRALRWFALAAASKLRCLLNPEAIVRYSAATASRRKRAVPAAAAVVDAAAMTAADAAAAAAVATNLNSKLQPKNEKADLQTAGWPFRLPDTPRRTTRQSITPRKANGLLLHCAQSHAPTFAHT